MIRPLNDRLLVERDAADSMIGSFIIPDAYKKKTLQGKVVAVGEGKIVTDIDGAIVLNKEGMPKRIPLTCKVGDRVLFSQHAGVDVKFGKKEYTLMKEEGVLGILEPSEPRC